MDRLSIIIPVYNEGENLVKVIQHLVKNINTKFKILICYDNENDNLFDFKNEILKLFDEIELVKNRFEGSCGAVKTGLLHSNSEARIVYPADDMINGNIIDKMYAKFLDGYDIVAPSRFMKGGSMKNCPLLKSILVRFSSFTLYKLSSIPIEDASNGFRLFSRKLLDNHKIESDLGFAYSLELLVKADRFGYKIIQVPAQWLERTVGDSNFKIFKWLKQYLKWYFYGLASSWLLIKKK